MAQTKTNCGENLEVIYEKYKDVGTNVYKEYEAVYKIMWSKLNADILKPFEEALKKHQNIVLKNQDELVNTVKHNLEQQMQQALDNFWNSYGVSEALISLEMCKDKFKSFKDHKWNMEAKTPWERTRPIRIRFKENRLRFLQAQLSSQDKLLRSTLQENAVLRQHIKDVKDQRVSSLETITNFRKNFESNKAAIMELQYKTVGNNSEQSKNYK